SYCTNVHPGNTVDEVIDGLSEHTAEVRRQLDAPMAAGLWLCRSAVSELLEDAAALERLAQTLWQHDLCCYTLNAFPFGDFHSERVKEQVYLPDWTSNDRLNYTKDCARILAELLPEGSEGSISTVPLGGRMNPTTPASTFHSRRASTSTSFCRPAGHCRTSLSASVRTRTKTVRSFRPTWKDGSGSLTIHIMPRATTHRRCPNFAESVTKFTTA
ncbi:MAG: hypothetical protein GY826_36470, partial [Fuerstiella sp.]|nr:hypothetical protein [Fuerstiella sp.]